MNTMIFDTASQDHKIISPKPKGYTFYGSELIYPSPGCYQFTAFTDQNTIDIVIKILSPQTWIDLAIFFDLSG